MSSKSFSEELTELQRRASHCAWLFQTYRVQVEYRILYAMGSSLPWRLFEIHRDTATRNVSLRRMHCFSNAEKLRRCIEERIDWKRQDRLLVAALLPNARRALAASGPTNSLQRVQQVRDGLVTDMANLDPIRRALRAKVCQTRPDRIVDLMPQEKSDGTQLDHTL